MTKPVMSKHFQERKPSAIRLSQVEFNKRTDGTKSINTAIGNVNLPLHPAMINRMKNLLSKGSMFEKGVVRYTPTAGLIETNEAFLRLIRASGHNTDGLHSQVTIGGSQAMGLCILGVCGEAGTGDKPLLLIDAAYTNYNQMAKSYGRKVISISRHLHNHGKFSLPTIEEIEEKIQKHNPGGIVVIPYDNPTGHLYKQKTLIALAKLCVKYNMWMISDEAYRELHYTEDKGVSIWGINEEEVPGISGRRISIETASKVWNGCGLRVGALVTDNEDFHHQSIAENTKELCPPAMSQYIFAAINDLSDEEIKNWFEKQRNYYKSILNNVTTKLKEAIPGIIVSNPDAAIYSVVDVRNIAKPSFDSEEFVKFCAREGKVDYGNRYLTLLTAPMKEFYSPINGDKNPGDTQVRIAYVKQPKTLEKIPRLFSELFKQFEEQR